MNICTGCELFRHTVCRKFKGIEHFINIPCDFRDFSLYTLNVHFCQLNRWYSTELLNQNMVLCQVLEILAKNLLKTASNYHSSILKINKRKTKIYHWNSVNIWTFSYLAGFQKNLFWSIRWNKHKENSRYIFDSKRNFCGEKP